MIIFWSILLGLPIFAFGAMSALKPAAADALCRRFESSRAAALALTAVGWLWAAYECDTIGIDVFDMLLKRFPGQLWLMAAILCYLTFIWMPKNLSVRALTGILMLIPAELFKTTRLYRPAAGEFAAIHVIVVVAYALCIVGMYGMFYPWRLEKALSLVLARPALARAFGLAAAAVGLAVIIVGIVV